MENIDISSHLTKENNTIVIEVAGYYCSSFYVMRQSSFLQAEVVSGENVLISTTADFSARINPYYIRKVQRYSFQRPFAESYKLYNPKDSFFTDFNMGNEPLAETEEKNIIERTVPYPKFERLIASPIGSGQAVKIKAESYTFDRYFKNVGFGDNDTTGWQAEELDSAPEKDWQEMSFTPLEESLSGKIADHRYRVYELPHNSTGMISFTVSCDKPLILYVAFDEILSDKTVNPLRIRNCNIIRYELAEGKHNITCFEVYTMKYIQLVAMGADCNIEGLSLIEYKHPQIEVPQFSDEKLQRIAQAAVETFRQNAVDLFTDCPSRERAGWLCDSFFLARAEFVLAGKNTVEEAFLENFLHEENYKNLPEGMVPMCYPADHWDGTFIPNWALWLIIELSDYKKRNGKPELIKRFRNKLYGILDYFKAFENTDGLLEGLDGWVFVEWSRANDSDMVSGVNYPSNMLYYAALNSVAELYSDFSLAEKAEKLKKKINEQSYDGSFFLDHAVRTDKGITSVSESTEVCQYYAFFCGIATPDTYPELFSRLVNEFGPKRDMNTVYPNVHKAAPFIGNYLRLEILKNNGYGSVVTENIKDYFYYMAERTGTLWETAETSCSCNHGFASCVLYWML